jgi:hypothetical protein
MGGPNFNVFEVGPDAAAHVAQVFMTARDLLIQIVG